VARGADVVSHEATFDRRMHDKAQIAQHSTATMAGAFGRQINARHLFLTHFSSRYSGAVMQQTKWSNRHPPNTHVTCSSLSPPL
jgi:ribonuclease BN (tRNA processing enzyme)